MSARRSPKAISPFQALDAANIALMDLRGTLALLSAVVVEELEDPDDRHDLIAVVERHVRRDMAALCAAEDKARAAILGGRAR